MSDLAKKFTAGFFFTLGMNKGDFVALKSDPPTVDREPRYRILAGGTLFDDDTKVAVRCSNYTSDLKYVPVDDVVFPDHFTY